jgi:hypothetical protein
MRVSSLIIVVVVALLAVGVSARALDRQGVLNPHPATPPHAAPHAAAAHAAHAVPAPHAAPAAHAAAHPAAPAAAAPAHDDSPAATKARFNEFKAKYRTGHRAYKSADAEAKAYEKFALNRRAAHSLNTVHGKGKKVFSSVSPFADIDPAEFKRQRHGTRLPAHPPLPTKHRRGAATASVAASASSATTSAPHHAARPHGLMEIQNAARAAAQSEAHMLVEADVVGEAQSSATVVAPFDWRTRNAVSAVKDQGQCGDW